jgi:uncharacterized protein YheU (UPF0270 family)
VTEDPSQRGVEIAPDSLSASALRGLVEEFVTRSGTDYGDIERTTDEKIDDVLRQLDSGEARIVFDPQTETANIVAAKELLGS